MYEFPKISTIDDVLPAIKDAKEFIVAEKDGYTVINYVVSMPDTFPPVIENGVYNLNAALRRECRGIVFDENGKLLSRRYHKFFNLNEKPETHIDNVDFLIKHHILTKLDGSMITPLLIKGDIRWGTKMGLTDVALVAEAFAKKYSVYDEFADFCYNLEMTPIFEWCSRKQRIVLDYKEDNLILTAIRHNYTGEYVSNSSLLKLAEIAKIPLVESFASSIDNIESFRDYLKDMQDIEGVVISFVNGHKLKMKTDWYMQIHNAKDFMRREWDVVNLILSNQIDDILPLLLDNERNIVENFISDLMIIVNKYADIVYNETLRVKKKYDNSKKEYALSEFKNPDITSMIFKLWDNTSNEHAIEVVIKWFLKNTNKKSVYENFKNKHFSELKFESLDEE